jgi:hypothetical protein
VADGAVAVAGAALGLEHRLVDVQRPAGIGRQRVQHARQPGLSRWRPPPATLVAMAPALIIGFSGRPVPVPG